MTWMPLVATIVAWCVALLTVLAIRGRQLSRKTCGLVLLSATLGAGGAQWVLLQSLRAAERESAARLLGVSSLRLRDDVELCQQLFQAPPAQESSEQADQSPVDWDQTFAWKSQDISETLAASERNDFLRRYHSVQTSEIEFRRHQLNQVASRVTFSSTSPSQASNIDRYLEDVTRAANLLQGLAQDLRK